jgi:sulfur relay (sulfurtransferase) complex TusBCD TusD component (DsrE family)
MPKKTLSFALMDAPYESANLTTAFRILDAAAKRGHDINVFAYEGAAALAFTRQSPHPNPVYGKNLAEDRQQSIGVYAGRQSERPPLPFRSVVNVAPRLSARAASGMF